MPVGDRPIAARNGTSFQCAKRPRVKAMNTTEPWVDPNDAPELGREWFDKAKLKVDGVEMKRPRGRQAGSNKEQITLRLDRM